MFEYDVFTEEEALNLIPDGDYQAEILEFNTQDRNGNPLRSQKGDKMVNLKLNVIVGSSNRGMSDFIVLNKQWAWKFRHLCDSIGKIKEYEEKKLDVNTFVGALTWVTLTTQEAKGNYQKRNSVGDYIKLEDQKTLSKQSTLPDKEVEEFFDDQIPF